jgi:hypothetical protein
VSRGRGGLALVLGVGGGLALAGASLASWARQVRTDDVAGIPVDSEVVTLGVELAPLALPAGIVAAALGFALAIRVDRVRRAVGALLVLAGGFGLVVVARGGVAAAELGALGSGTIVAGVSAVAVAAAGLLAIRPTAPPPPALPARYDLDADDADREWDLASVEEEDET